MYVSLPSSSCTGGVVDIDIVDMFKIVTFHGCVVKSRLIAFVVLNLL